MNIWLRRSWQQMLYDQMCRVWDEEEKDLIVTMWRDEAEELDYTEHTVDPKTFDLSPVPEALQA